MPSPSETTAAADTRSLDDGGPAFPRPDWNGSWKGPDTFSGMSLRDWFAGQVEVPQDLSLTMASALTGRPHAQPQADKAAAWLEVDLWWAEAEAAYRYKRADAMLAERAKAVRS